MPRDFAADQRWWLAGEYEKVKYPRTLATKPEILNSQASVFLNHGSHDPTLAQVMQRFSAVSVEALGDHGIHFSSLRR